MGKIVIRDGIKWDYDWRTNKWTFIEKIVEEEPIQQNIELDYDKIIEKPKKAKYKKNKELDY